MSDTANKKRLGIVVCGGPAPGINGVIHSATIEAATNGFHVVGILDGFKHLMEGRLVSIPLTIDDVSRIHLKGGSILRTSRANPSRSEDSLRRCGEVLTEAGIGYLLVIGGDDTAYAAYRVARKELGRLERLVEKLDERERELHEALAAAATQPDKLVTLGAELRKVESEKATAEERWLELAAEHD